MSNQETEKEFCVELSLYCRAKTRNEAMDKANIWVYEKNEDKQYQIWVENAGEMLS